MNGGFVNAGVCLRCCGKERKTLLGLLVRAEAPSSQGEAEEARALVSQRLQKELSGFFNTLLHCLTHTSDRYRCHILRYPLNIEQVQIQCLRAPACSRERWKFMLATRLGAEA